MDFDGIRKWETDVSLDEIITRCSHIGKEIFDQVDDKRLGDCREVSKLWKSSIDDNNLFWKRIVNVPALSLIHI